MTDAFDFDDNNRRILPHATANFPSKCPGCGERIHEGDDIFKCEERWLCETCAEEYSS